MGETYLRPYEALVGSVSICSADATSVAAEDVHVETVCAGSSKAREEALDGTGKERSGGDCGASETEETSAVRLSFLLSWKSPGVLLCDQFGPHRGGS